LLHNRHFPKIQFRGNLGHKRKIRNLQMLLVVG
jgi:hypothetical protein